MKTTLIFLLLISLASSSFGQGKLGRAKDSISGKSSSHEKSSSNDYSSDSDSGGFLFNFFGNLIIGMFTAPPDESYSTDYSFQNNDVDLQWLYDITLGIPIGHLEPRCFYLYPYAEGQHGEYDTVGTFYETKRSVLLISNTAVVQPDVIGNDFNLNWRFIPEMGLEFDHLHFVDIIGEREELGFTSFMLNFYRIRERKVTGYWGIGGNYAGSGVNSWGFTYHLGLDIFVGQPTSLGTSWKQSFINESTVNEFQAMIKYHIKRLEIRGGFNDFKIGSENFPGAAFGLGYRF